MEMKTPTLLTHLGEEDCCDPFGAVVPPIYQNTLFKFKDWQCCSDAFSNPYENYTYTRGNNPTVSLVEEKIAALCGGEDAKLFASGMGAISSAIMHCIKAGDHVITIKNTYGPTNNFFNKYLREKFQIETTFIDGNDIQEFEDALQENTSLIYLESPSSAKFTLQDLEAVAKLAKKHNIKTAIDNTWATPFFQKPLKLGIDLEIHSCTKYIGGHSDVISGVIVGSQKDIKEIFDQEHAIFGAKTSPFEAWLLLRSMRTLDIRMEKHMKTGLKIAEFLDSHPKVRQVLHPGLKSFPQYELGKKQMSGYSSLMGLEIDTDDEKKVIEFINALRYFKIGVSWGGHESLIISNALLYKRELSYEQFQAMDLPINLVRIATGFEDPDDLIDDLSNALSVL